MTCRIDVMDDATASRWDAYITQSPQATLFHSTLWKQIVESVYGCPGTYLYAHEQDRIRGILPVFLCGGRVSGRSLVALPFAAAQPSVCADDEAVEQVLVASACDLAREHGIQTVELREDAEKPWAWPVRQTYINVLLPLDPDPEVVWRTRVESNVRSRVNSARENGLVCRWGSRDHVDAFFHLYARTMHRLGSPPHAKALFEHTCDAFSDRAAIALVMYEDQPIAGAVVLRDDDWIGFPWAASLATTHHLRPNNLLYWHIIEYACRNGYETLDMGRSPVGSGTLHFKMQWGGTARPLWYYYHMPSGQTPPVRDASSPMMRAASRLWRCLPERLSTRLGPHLARLIP